jgi:[acyl-carrier-protein] S-malonyltransferase
VLSGHTQAVDLALEKAKIEFKLVAKKLNVSAPFHCDLMEPAAHSLGTVLASMNISKPRVPLVSNVTASEVRSSAFDIERQGVRSSNHP